MRVPRVGPQGVGALRYGRAGELISVCKDSLPATLASQDAFSRASRVFLSLRRIDFLWLGAGFEFASAVLA